MTAPAVPLAQALTGAHPVPFVDRPELWERLERHWECAVEGGRRLVLLGGEAGVGKTRLVTEFARSVHDDGDGLVLHGTCSEHAPLPYQPFAEALDHAARALGDRFDDLVGPAAREVGRIVPHLAFRTAPATGGPGDPDAERFRLFAAITATLEALAAGRPLLLVLDDVHWAQEPTMQLVEHLSRSGPAGTCALLTYRSTPADASAAFKRALPGLRSRPGTDRQLLGPFGAEDVRRFVEAASGHRFHIGLHDVVAMLIEQTGGNAFLLSEVWRHLVEAQFVIRPHGRWRLARPLEELDSPEGVREVVDARLSRLSEPTRRLLGLASVAGDTFDAPTLAATTSEPVDVVLDLLEPAVDGNIVEIQGSDAFRFTHGLVRHSIYDGLARGRRRRDHLDLARALEDRGDEAVTEVAYHLVAAVPLCELEVAVAAARRAASWATAAVAYADAARHLEAVRVLTGQDRLRCELSLEVADAYMRAGDVETAQECCTEANRLARELGDESGQVAAAIAYDEANWRAGSHGGMAEALLRAALPLAADRATEVRLQAALGRALAFSGQGAQAWEVSRAALAAARVLGEPDVLRAAYTALLFAPWTPATIHEQLAAAREFVELARLVDNLEWELWALDKLIFGSITVGRLDREALVRHHELAERLGQPLFRVLDLQAHALVATAEGRFDDAEGLAERAEQAGVYVSGGAATGGYGVQLFGIRREQGRLEEARPMVEAVANLGDQGATWQPALCLLYAELGMEADARTELARLVADGLPSVPRDALWLASLSYLADAAVAVDDRRAAKLLYRELLPYRGLVVQAGTFLGAYGSVDRYLGALAASTGQARDAAAHFEDALVVDVGSGMSVWEAHTRYSYGRFLIDRRPERAGELLRLAAGTAGSKGMPVLAAAAAAALDKLHAPVARGSTAAGLTDRELAVLRLLVAGRSNRDIGVELHISHHTASNHVRAILLKTGCVNRTEAAGWAVRNGLAPG